MTTTPTGRGGSPHDLVDPNLVRGDLRDALEESWTIDPHNPDGETATWHLRTEEAIERQIEWLRDEQDVIDEDDTFNLRIDYTTHNYSKHSSTDSDAPVGVHKQTHLETGTRGRNSRAHQDQRAGVHHRVAVVHAAERPVPRRPLHP